MPKLKPDPDIAQLVQRHAQELVRSFFTDLAARIVTPPVQAEVAPPEFSTALWDGKTRTWCCPRCRVYRDARRRAVSAHAIACTGAAAKSASK